MAIEKMLYDFDAYLRQKKWEQSYIVPKQVKSTGGISLDNYTMSFKHPVVCKVLGYSKKSEREGTYETTIPFDVYILELTEDVAADPPDTRGITAFSTGETFFSRPEDCTPITQNGGAISLLTHVYQAVTAPRKVAVACR